MSKKFVKIEDFLQDENYLKISGYSRNEIVEEGGTPTEITLATHTETYRELMYQYGERAILVRDDENALTVFTNLFTEWEKRRGDDIATLLDAYTRVYNPIENYDRIDERTGYDKDEEIPDTNGRYHKVTQTPTNWKTTVDQTPTNWKTEDITEPGEDGYKIVETESKQDDADTAGETVNKVVPFGGATPVTVSKTENNVATEKATETQGQLKTTSEQKGTYKTETSQTGTFETKDELVGVLENKKTYNSQLHAHGNIGTASAQDLLEKEMRVRMIDIFKTVILEFINEYTVYA